MKGYDILDQPDDVKRVTGMLAESPGLYEKLSGHEFLEFMGPSTMSPGRSSGAGSMSC